VELNHSFTVPATLDETWEAFNDIESVAECFPGATVTSVEADSFTGTCKVKLGPISLVYAGTGKFLEKDESARRFVVEAKGKDKRGNGTAGATVTASFAEAGEGSTKVDVLTDLAITGKPAQFGRGVIQDVSEKLLGQFTTCLESKVGAATAAPPGSGAEAAAPAAAPAEPAGEPLTSPRTADATKGATEDRAGSRPDDALDLGAAVLPILLKTYWRPLAGVLFTLMALLALRARRRRPRVSG